MDKQSAIAVVGLALRFPGADNKREFWDNLRNGKDSIETRSAQELIARGADPALVASPNYVRRVSRLRNPEMFDANYFSMTSREAQMADPQLRVLLEVCQEAIDDSAHVLSDTNTGIFVGVADNDFWVSRQIYNHPTRIGGSLANRVLAKKDYAATQLSHKLNLTGPSFNVMTACSSSAVAVHEAVTHLLMYECDFALAGGCEIDQGIGYLYEEGGIDSRDGYCRAFDAKASGTVFGSGCGIVVLRRLEDALDDGDHIYGIILGSRINNDGRQKAGFTTPSVVGQSKVIRDALAAAGVDARSVSYVEAHGTGTLIGDPIEIDALTQAFRQITDRQRFCGIGSVKTNLGHLSIAAGVAGLIKTLLALQHKQIPATLYFDEPNPSIDFTNSPFRVVTALEDWKSNANPRIAGVSSFGVGGTNSHMLLHEAPPRRASGASRPHQLIVMSAKSDDALATMRADIASELTDSMSESRLADTAYTLQIGRSEFPLRCALVCNARNASSVARQHPNWVLGSAKDNPTLGFVLGEKTLEQAGAVRCLYLHDAEFRFRIDACAEILIGLIDVDVRTFFVSMDDFGESAKSSKHSLYAQSISFSVSYALCGLLRSWGVSPTLLIGEGVGEYVLACDAEIFSLADSLKLIVARTKLFKSWQVNGAAADEPGRERALMEFRAEFSKVETRPPNFASVFNARIEPLTHLRAISAEYWIDQLRSGARLTGHADEVAALGCNLFCDFGENELLAAALNRSGLKVVEFGASGREGVGLLEGLLHTLGILWVEGVKVDWNAFSKNETRNRVDLRPYPFQRKKYWVDSRSPLEPSKLTRASVHPLLGQIWSSSDRVKSYENFISAHDPSYLADHKMDDSVIFPGAAHIEMALAAARIQIGPQPVRIEGIQFERALMLGDDARHLQTTVYQEKDGSFSFEIGCRVTGNNSQERNSEHTWRLHSRGSFKPLSGKDSIDRIHLSDLRRRVDIPNPLEFYESEVIAYGPSFRGLVKLWTKGNEVLGRIELPRHLSATANSYRFHPVLLDSCFQAIGAITSRNPELAAALPVGLVNCDLYSDIPPNLWVHIVCSPRNDVANSQSEAKFNISFSMFADTGEPLAHIESFERKALSGETTGLDELADDLCYEIAWAEQNHTEVASATDAPSMVLLCDDANIANQLAELASTRQATILDYTQDRNLEQSTRAAIAELSRGSAPVEIVMMRISDREQQVADLCDVLLRVVHVISEESTGRTISLSIVTKGCQSVVGSSVERLSNVSGAALWGLGTTIRRELADLRCLRIDLDPHSILDATLLIREFSRPNDEDLIAYRGLTRYVARLRRLQEDDGAPYPFNVRAIEFGTFDTIGRHEHCRTQVDDDQIEVQIFATGLNFKETLIVLGLLKTGSPSALEVPLGFEGAGRVIKIGSKIDDLAVGDDVIVWGNGCLASHIIVCRERIIKFDAAKISYEQAASLPTVFMTAHYALRVLAKLRKGDKILIHAAAGGVGQAAVQIAHAAGAEIFATASRGKWEHLSKQGIHHIFDSRDTGFGAEVLKATDGCGVDVVLNSLTGDFIAKSFDALARNGRFIEIGKLNIWTEEHARSYRSDVAYFAFELGSDISTGEKGSHLESWLRPTLEAIDLGQGECPPVRVFPIAETVSAFRWLASGRSIGKAVIRIHDPVHRGSHARIIADRPYLVTGGLGALGLHVLRWLLESGAREITLLSRREPSEDVSLELERLRENGASIVVSNCDISERDEVVKILNRMPNLAGVFHCAGILDDGTLANLNRTRFEKVLRPKVGGVQILHELTLNLPLDIFVCFSSTSALLDGAGQGNYAAANAYLDSLALYRRKLGLPALAINWGGWSGAGMASDLEARKPGMAHSLLNKDQALAALGKLIGNGYVSAIVAPMRGRLSRAPDVPSLYSELVPIQRLNSATDKPPGAATPLVDDNAFEGGAPRTWVTQLLKEEVGKALGLNPDELREEDDFIEAGVDSLMLAELRNNLQRALNKKLPVTAFIANSNIAALANHIVEEYFVASNNASHTVIPAKPVATADIVQLNPSLRATKLFCIPGVGDNLFDFQPLSETDIDLAICVLQPRIDITHETFEPNEISFLAKQYAKAIVGAQATGPYHLVGYSFGGSVAVETANQLAEMNHAVATLTLMDSIPSFRHRDNPRYRHYTCLSFFYTLFESFGVDRQTIEEFCSRAIGMDTENAEQHFRQVIATANDIGRVDSKDIDQWMIQFKRRMSIPYQLERKRISNARVTQIKASRPLHARALDSPFGLSRIDSAYGWEELLENEIEIVQMDCSHLGLVKFPNIDRVAKILAERCTRADTDRRHDLASRYEIIEAHSENHIEPPA